MSLSITDTTITPSTGDDGGVDGIYNRGDQAPTILRAVCAYLQEGKWKPEGDYEMSNIKEIGILAWLGGAVIIPLVGFFIVRYIGQIDLKIKDLYDKHDKLKEAVDRLLGEHNALKDYHNID